MAGLILAGAGLAGGMLADAEKAKDALGKAEKLFKDQHWAEARAAYDRARDLGVDWRSPEVRAAVEGAVACSVKLQQWDEAVTRAEEYIAKTKGSPEEAIGERFLAGLYMSMPHHGTKQGGKYLRGQWTQGVQISSFKKDRKEAIARYERARKLLIELREKLEKERPARRPAATGTSPTKEDPQTAEQGRQMERLLAEQIRVNFDLASALAARNPYGGYGGWMGWDWWWNGFEAEEDSEAVEDADYEEPRWAWGWNPDNQRPPTGIPLGPDGKPQFVATPKEYTASAGDGGKIRFLLEEVERLDQSEKRDEAARALFRRAMIARSLYGSESAKQWRNYFASQQGEADPDAEASLKKVWDLEDDEALTLVGGRLRVVTLRAGESPLALLRSIARKYPQSEVVPEAKYAQGLFYQTRQQFPEAIREYRELLEAHPSHARANAARTQIARIERADAAMGQTGVYLPDTNPRLSFTYRNCEAVEFKAFEFDLFKYVRDRMDSNEKDKFWIYRNIQWDLLQADKERWKKYLGSKAAEWTEKANRPAGHRVAEGATAAPLSRPGAFIVEARPAGTNDVSRTVVLVTDIAMVQKNLAGKGLIWVVDARTGQPLQGKAVRMYERWMTYDGTNQTPRLLSEVFTTSEDGTIEYTRKRKDGGSSVDAIMAGEGGRMAFSFFQSWNDQDYASYHETGPRYFVITDRPVYRPGSKVKYRVWLRNLAGRTYGPLTGSQTASVIIYDAKGNQVQSTSLPVDKFGCASGEFELGPEPPLGMYQIQVNGHQPGARYAAGGMFRVEEYRKPEFEVLVKPSASQARLGETVKARIEARYYFGAPVAGGEVSYKVFRENYRHVYWGAGEYDWLYGVGYGRYLYAYPWLPWWGRWGCYIICDGWWPGSWGGHRWGRSGYFDPNDWQRRYESGTRKALRDVVMQGKGTLAADGSIEIEIDTSPAKREMPDRDHRYSIEVEVRDASRRTVEGSGSVKVTRQAFYAFVEAHRGWYQPGSEAFVEVRTLTADNVPVAARGEVVVYRIRYGGANNAEVKEEEVKRWAAETDAEGRLSFRYQVPGEGQFRIVFATKDAAGEEVLGNAVFWVTGPGFEGREYRFNDLEIIADKRTYAVGEVAHLLINTAASNTRILFSDEVSGGTLRSYRFIDLPDRSTVIDVPVKDTSVPNFFVEATLVRDGRLAMEMRELFVPPADKLLNVSIRTDKPTYQPGEKGMVEVEVTDSSGKPGSGQVTLAAYDEAVAYIQDETGPGPKVFFHGQKRYHRPQAEMSSAYTFQAWGGIETPEHYVHEGGGPPEGWHGWWGLERGGLALHDFDASKSQRAGVANLAHNGELSAPVASAADAVGGAGFAARTRWRDDRGIRSETKANEGPVMAEAQVRTDFADTALWQPALELNAEGKARTEITFPQSLTTWRLRGYALSNATQVGDATAKAITTKNLLVRLQSPRFFVERDEVVLSANVHNYLKSPKRVVAELIVPARLFGYLGPTDKTPRPDAEGNLHLRAQAEIKPEGTHRFDWPVRALEEGMATITVKALTDEESDAMRMAFPVLVHGINKTVAQSGSFRVPQDGERTLSLELPNQIDPAQTRLEIVVSPSLAGVMVDALPYLAGYPYGCVEQTMSRFYPSVLVAQALRKMGTSLEAIGEQRKQMNEADLKHRFGRYPESPVFDSKELERMVQAGLARIYDFQHSDGGWGWWKEDASCAYQTAYVIQGLYEARQAGVNVDGGVYDRGLQFLQGSVSRELAKPKNQRDMGHVQTQTFLAYALSLDKRLAGDEMIKWLDELYGQRGELNNYGRALLALTMHNMDRKAEAATLLRNVLQFVETDDSNETAWVRTPAAGWWFWWNNDIETNAWTLRALVKMEPQNELGPRLVKWLLNNRRNGYYWRSTRDTALTISAMIDFMQVTGEASPEYLLTVRVDGRPAKEVRVTKSNFFTFDNRVAVYGPEFGPGAHEISIAKKGPGALYYSAYLSYFTKEDEIKGAGNEIFVDRQYFKLVPRTRKSSPFEQEQDQEQEQEQDQEQDHDHDRNHARDRETRRNPQSGIGRLTFERVPLKLGDAVTSGEQIEVVLNITTKNVYDYLAFEDMKPAGCEPVELRSGGRWAGGLCANLELRDEKVVFFIGLLEQGTHTLRYRLRAETPGVFHALPTTGFAMYAPEIRAISDVMHLRVEE